MKNAVYLGLGSNQGDAAANLRKAMDLLKDWVGVIERSSSFYETEAWGYESSNAFVNAVILISTDLNVFDLLSEVKNIEKEMGRKSSNSLNYEDRIIDLDILYFNREIYAVDGLNVPHRLLDQRRFVLLPLCEIAADFVDPKRMKTIKRLLSECLDQGLLKQI